MAIRILHTADWQLGKPFAGLSGDTGALLRAARFDAVRTIARLAREHEVDAVLVAGDVFDDNYVERATVAKALAAMREFDGPWLLLPGNHDPALAASVWTRIAGDGPPEQVRLATTPEPLPVADGMAVVLPAPLTERHSQDDLTAWIDQAQRHRRRRCGSGSRTVPSPTGCRPTPMPGTRSPPTGPSGRGWPIWRWATGTGRSRSPRGPGTRARPSPTATRPTPRARCCWWRSTGRMRRPASPPLRPATIAGAR